MKISSNHVVTVSYVVTDETDKVVGRTDPKHPIVALIGHDYFVPGLEKALIDHEKGDEFIIELQPKDAYGEINQNLIQSIDRAMFGDFDIEVGNAFEADTTMGPCLVVIKEITADKVIVDGNHPLAGQTLKFFVTVEDIREATAEELEHGHVHVDGICPSEHHCCCGGHGHKHEEGEHHCCCGGHGHNHEDGEHECCGGHGHKHEDGEHECCCGGHGHKHEDGEHECCGGHGHNHEDGEHECCCGGHGHKHND